MLADIDEKDKHALREVTRIFNPSKIVIINKKDVDEYLHKEVERLKKEGYYD